MGDRQVFIEDFPYMTRYYLVDTLTGEVCDEVLVNKGNGHSYTQYHEVLEGLKSVRGRSDLEDLMKDQKNEKVFPPKDFNIKIAKRQYEKLMALIGTVVGYNYTYLTAREIFHLWGYESSPNNAHVLLRQFEKWGLIKVDGIEGRKHRKGEYLIEVNPFYVWKARTEYGRDSALRRFYGW